MDEYSVQAVEESVFAVSNWSCLICDLALSWNAEFRKQDIDVLGPGVRFTVVGFLFYLLSGAFEAFLRRIWSS